MSLHRHSRLQEQSKNYAYESVYVDIVGSIDSFYC